MSLRGYVQLRRGLLEHLPNMCGSDLKCYIAIVLIAGINTGRVDITTRDLAEAVGSGSNRVSESLRRLEEAKYIKVKKAKNQYSVTSIQITKWNKSAAYQMSAASGQQAGSKRAARIL